MIVFPLSTHEGGDSEIAGFTNTFLEVERVSEVKGGTNPRPILSVGHF
jgi:hypothetical protein